MNLQANDALILGVETRSFKGRDGQDVTFVQAKILDDDNELHNVTVPIDFDWAGIDPNAIWRQKASVEISVEEVNRNGKTSLRKRLVSVK